METAPLKSFATSARTELIREVGARITAVLAQGSSERVEQPQAVSALERAIASAGGGGEGKTHVADKVAYTWFNRIIALRFMDANGYTGIGVISPAADQVGQPEVLSAAKRGQVDTEVVKATDAAIITGLLSGTRQPRRGAGAQAEAYSLLLADYCRYWNAAMPFMFECEGDYTELLIPANLLAGDSVLSRSLTVLTEDVCKDVEVIGWLYQFYISERKDQVFAGFKKNKKAGAEEIPAATQLFTPHWIVRYLVENSVGRLWMLNRPKSGLASHMDYYIAPVDVETDFLKISKPEELKVIDPACGSGHMLTYAFDLLYAIYEEEGYAPSEIPGLILANNLYGTEIDPRAGALAGFALTMKAAAKRKLFLKNAVKPNICVIAAISFAADELSYLVTRDGDRDVEGAFWDQFTQADTLGALIMPDPALTTRLARHLETVDSGGDLYKADAIYSARQVIRQAEFLSSTYSVVVANPPYMGGGNMGTLLADFAKRAYKATKSDLFAMFIERSFDLLKPSGYSAMVTMESWMFLKSFKEIRQSIVQEKTIENLLHMPYSGRGSTSMGINFGTVATIVRNAHVRGVEANFQCVRYFETANGIPLEFPVRNDRLARVDPERFASIPGTPIAYWFPDGLLNLFEAAPKVSGIARVAIGMITGSNALFVRQWWEVPASNLLIGASDRESAKASACRWFPYAKGGDFRRWAGNTDAVVDWQDDGRALQTTSMADGSRIRAHNFNLDRIFSAGIVWTVVTSGALSFRKVGQGFLFDAAAGICQGSDDDYLLALLNSRAAAQVLHGLNPTLNMHPGYLEAVPMPDDERRDDIRALARRAIEISTRDWDAQERSWAFDGSPLLGRSDRVADAIDAVREEWDEISAELCKIEESIDGHFDNLFGLSMPRSGAQTTSLSMNLDFAYAAIAVDQRVSAMTRDLVGGLVSYAVGCMFGRYSLDEPGLVLADGGATLQDYLAKVPTPTFTPDADNVIPIVDGDWFEDDVVGLVRKFLRSAFGDQHFEQNLKYVTESLGVKNLRDYFITRAGRSKFYDDHVQRYKKRPIYWLFSSPKGAFNALIYMHRYTPSTVSKVLIYLREYVTKLESALQQAERAGSAKEADRLRKILVELNEYEHDTLYPKASENVVIDPDDGVKRNYPKFGTALRNIAGLEASGD